MDFYSVCKSRLRFLWLCGEHFTHSAISTHSQASGGRRWEEKGSSTNPRPKSLPVQIPGPKPFLSSHCALGLSFSLTVKWLQNTQFNEVEEGYGVKGQHNRCCCPGLQVRQETARPVFHPASPLDRHSQEPDLAGGPWGPWGQWLVQMGPDWLPLSSCSLGKGSPYCYL
jgi:hypothetical protein